MLSRTSSRVLTVALVVAVSGLALTLHQDRMQRAFAAPTTVSMGAVIRKGAFVRKGRHSSSESFCWVEYEFTPAAGGTPQRNWRLWEPGCGVAPGRPIPIQYVIAHPEVNRPAGESWTFPPQLLWFAAGVMLVFGFLLRRSDEDDAPPQV